MAADKPTLIYFGKQAGLALGFALVLVAVGIVLNLKDGEPFAAIVARARAVGWLWLIPGLQAAYFVLAVVIEWRGNRGN